MARRKPASPPEDFEEQISDIDVGDEMRTSFLEYAYSVIYLRALPDARDGLKPVQRRILYTMADMGLRPDRGHVKCARVTGEVMGKLHPHGDGAIYDALVRMGQSWTMRVPTIDGHGNFGNLDDGPAQMRYCVTGDTRVRLPERTVRIDELVDLPPNSERDADFEVLNKDGRPVRVEKVFNSGVHPTKRLVTSSGHAIRGSHNHPVLCLVPVAGLPMLMWLQLDEVEPGTVVCLAANAGRTAFPDAAEEAAGKRLVESLAEHESVGEDPSSGGVPAEVLDGAVGLMRAFLMAWFDRCGRVSTIGSGAPAVRCAMPDGRFADRMQELLLEFGVHSERIDTVDDPDGWCQLVISGSADVRTFTDHVGFFCADRNWAAIERSGPSARAARMPHPQRTREARLVVDADHAELTELLQRAAGPRRSGEEEVSGDGALLTALREVTTAALGAGRGRAATRLTNSSDDPEYLKLIAPIVESGFRFVEVAEVVDCEPAEVYSLRVGSDDHSFLAGGFVNHNTECRMTPSALAMTSSLDEDVVDFKPNYDGRETEPQVLPSAIPNLLVNGSTGIAVGMATNLAPHNLGEVVQALRHLLRHPDASLDDLMRFVPGPDLPTGGKIVGLEGIRDAYATGRGAFRMRATVRIENVTPRRKGIVVTELPYNVGPERVMERVKTLVQSKKLQGIADLKDLTDREHGLRLVIEVKNGFHPEALLEQLYRLTPMEESFNINSVALVDGQPRTLGLKELMEVYLAHRIDVTSRRTRFRLAKASDRLHLVDGLLIAILDIDAVIAVIRGSDDAAQAKDELIARFELTEVQAQYILDMQLRRLTKFSKLELEKERTELERTIGELNALLEDDALLKKLVSEELNQAAKEFGSPRRTVLLESAGQVATAAVPLEVADDPCRVLLSSTGLLARNAGVDELPAGGERAKHDVVLSAVRATARGQVGLVTSAGRLLRLDVLDMPALPSTASAPNLAGGAPLSEFVSLAPDERALALTTLDVESPGLALGTAQGVVKRVRPEHLANRDEWEVIALGDGDRVVGAAELRTGAEDLVFITTDAQLLRFGADSVRPQGRSGGGIAGIRLSAGQSVVFFGMVDPGREAVVVTIAGSDGALPGTDGGSAKVTPYSEYPAKGRATGGVRCHRFLKGEDRLQLGWTGPAPARAAGVDGSPVDLPPAEGRRDGSGTPLPYPVGSVAGAPD